MSDSIQLAPRSLDMVRIIRQSTRCFAFGVMGALPILGLGLALQALRLRREVVAETNESWELGPVWVYWLAGPIALWAMDRWFGLRAAAAIFVVLAGAQALHLWLTFPAPPAGLWNPGRRHLLWGTVLACGGIYGSIAPWAMLWARLEAEQWRL